MKLGGGISFATKAIIMTVLGLSTLRPLEGFVPVPSNRGYQIQEKNEHQNFVETTSGMVSPISSSQLQLDLPMPCSENFQHSDVVGREKLEAEAISSPPPRPHLRFTGTIRDRENKSYELHAQHLRYKLVAVALLVISLVLIYAILVAIDNRSHARNILVSLACFKITIELQHPPSNDASPVTDSPFLQRHNIPTVEATILPDEEPNAELVEDGFTCYHYQ